MTRFAVPHTLMALALACVLAPACIPVTATVPVTPANSAQVSSCETLGTEHNLFVIGGTSFGVAGSTLAGLGAAVPNGTGKTDLGYSAMIVGGAMREIHPDHVETRLHHLQEDFGCTGSRADGSDNLCSAMHGFPRLCGIAWSVAASTVRRRA